MCVDWFGHVHGHAILAGLSLRFRDGNRECDAPPSHCSSTCTPRASRLRPSRSGEACRCRTPPRSAPRRRRAQTAGPRHPRLGRSPSDQVMAGLNHHHSRVFLDLVHSQLHRHPAMPVFVGQNRVPEFDPPPPPPVFSPPLWKVKYRPKTKPKYEYVSVRPYFQNLHDPETRHKWATQGYYRFAKEFSPWAASRYKGSTYNQIQTEDPRTIALREAHDTANEQAFDGGY